MITKVTITGADDSIQPARIIELSKEYPFVEWGILISKNNMGNSRFPSMDWIKDLYILRNRINPLNPNKVQLSAHLCGKVVRELAQGDGLALSFLDSFWYMFQRAQLNFHAIPHKYNDAFFAQLKRDNRKEFIFQYDDVNNHLIQEAAKAGVNCSALFDLSHGAGILPDEWPEPLSLVRCGYAGGLGPRNLEEQINHIENKAGNTEIWIDMETHVRTNEVQFDLDKVETCLKIAQPYIPKAYK